jgi:Ca-activated chloride channel homolog
MLLRNRSFPLVLLLAFGVVLSLTLAATGAPAFQQPPAPPVDPNQVPTGPEEDDPEAEQYPVTPQGQPADTVRVPPQRPLEPETGQDDTFIFRTQVEEVQLPVTVVDERRRLVTGLDRNAFTVYEDGVEQKITSFERRDIPVAVGILIDNSGSMRDKRAAVNQAALNFVRASNPRDEVFIVNFSDVPHIDQDFTSSEELLKEALERLESRGGTALYDAVYASSEHLKKHARLEKRVLLVITDGEDNASRLSLERAVRRLQDQEGPTVYTIGILGGHRERRARRALSALAEQSGGVAFFPRDVTEVDSITQAVARDIRNQYTIGYRPSRSHAQGGYRTIKVEAQARGHRRLHVRTRAGYFPGQDRAATGTRP